jgi:hypothetical protein
LSGQALRWRTPFAVLHIVHYGWPRLSSVSPAMLWV